MGGRATRKFFRVSHGITEHFGYLQGGRLQVYLCILKHTNHDAWWRGWTVRELAIEAGLTERQVRRHLSDLASPRGPKGRRYIQVWLHRGNRPNKLHVLRHISRGSDEKPLEDMGLDPEPDMGGIFTPQHTPNGREMSTTMYPQLPERCTSNVHNARSKLNELKALTRPLDSEDSEDLGEGKSLGTRGVVARSGPGPDLSLQTDDSEPLPEDPEAAATAALEACRAALPADPRRRR